MEHTTTTAALYEAILDDPDNTILRLLLADALDDSNIISNSIWAEFIRCQCEIYKLENTKSRQGLNTLKLQQKKLMDKLGIRRTHTNKAVHDITDEIWSSDPLIRYDRGLVSYIQASSNWWFNNADVQVKTNPINEVVFKTFDYAEHLGGIGKIKAEMYFSYEPFNIPSIDAGGFIVSGDEITSDSRGRCVAVDHVQYNTPYGVAISSTISKSEHIKIVESRLREKWPTIKTWKLP